MNTDTYMAKAMHLYKEGLRDPGRGARHGWFVAQGHRGARAGLDEAAVVRDILAVLPGYPDKVNIITGVRKAFAAQNKATGTASPLPPPRAKIRPAPIAAKHYIERGDDACEADFFDWSPTMMWWGDDWRLDTVAQLRALFHPDELVFCGDKFGRDVHTAKHWARAIFSGAAAPPYFIANPLKPEGGITSEGKHSPRCDAAVAAFRHAVVEFDEMPLADQLKFWAGWGLKDIVSLTYSGSKSIHALLRVDAANRDEWDQQIRDCLFRRHLIPLGCDGQCQNPARLTRLAGATRADRGGIRQKLIYCALPKSGWRE